MGHRLKNKISRSDNLISGIMVTLMDILSLTFQATLFIPHCKLKRLYDCSHFVFLRKKRGTHSFLKEKSLAEWKFVKCQTFFYDIIDFTTLTEMETYRTYSKYICLHAGRTFLRQNHSSGWPLPHRRPAGTAMESFARLYNQGISSENSSRIK